MDANRLFVDTNILVYVTDPQAPEHARAVSALFAAQSRGMSLMISMQVLREYLAVATRNKSNVQLRNVFENVRLFRRRLKVVEDRRRTMDYLLRLLEEVPTTGRQIHDANIVATMQANNIRSLLTHNTADFKRFSHLIELLDI
jgi:predicted nucleic acid-binding protein